MAIKRIFRRGGIDPRTNKARVDHFANVHVSDEDVADQQNKSAGAAVGVHGLTGAAFLQIPYTPEQVAQMEQRGVERVSGLEGSLRPTMQRVDQLSQQLQAVRSNSGAPEAIEREREIIKDFEKVPNSGVTEQQYRQARADVARMEAETSKSYQTARALEAEIEQLQGSVKAQRAALRRELMEDPTVRYTETVGGQMWRQHIDVNGSMGGMVADGVNAEPGAFIDIDSTVRGHGLTIAEGAQIINSDVNFEHGEGTIRQEMAQLAAAKQRGKRVTRTAEYRIRRPSGEVNISDTVADSVVTWQSGSHKDQRGRMGFSMEKIVRSKANLEAERIRRSQGIRDLGGTS